MLTFIRDVGYEYPNITSKTKTKYGIYLCSICNKEHKMSMVDVNRRHSKSCFDCRNIKHNESNSKLYKVWSRMKTRVKKDYKHKELTICNDWYNDYESFKSWAINNGYSDGLSIDRINNDGNYEPSNCRWTNDFVQSQNKNLLISKNTSGYRGVEKSKAKYMARICVYGKRMIIGRYHTPIEAAMAYDTFVIVYSTNHQQNFSTKYPLPPMKG